MKKQAALGISALILIIVALISYATVAAGHNKMVTMFGKVQPVVLPEGFHFVNHLMKFTSFDLRAVTET